MASSKNPKAQNPKAQNQPQDQGQDDPGTDGRRLTAAQKDLGRLGKEMNRKENELRSVRDGLDKAGKRADHYKALADSLGVRVSALELKIDELRGSIRADDPIGKGAYEVRTKAAQMIGTRSRPAGTLLGFFTCIEGFGPGMLVDAVHYGSAVVVEGDQHGLYTELMARPDMIEKLAQTENDLADAMARIRQLGGEEGEEAISD